MQILFRCVAEALIEQGMRRLMGVIPGGEALFDLAQRVWEKYREYQQDAQLLQQQSQPILLASPAEIQQLANTAVQTLPCSPAEKAMIAHYLTQIPITLRQSQCASPLLSSTEAPEIGIRTVLSLLPIGMPRFLPDTDLPGLPGWQLKRLLGIGGFGEVWLAQRTGFKSLKAAVKFCHLPYQSHLQHEAQLLDRLLQCGEHPQIVRLLNIHLEPPHPWLMYAYIEGGHLGERIPPFAHQPLTARLQYASATLLTLAHAVAYFHHQVPPIVHRDLKPTNILYDNQQRLYITDFGIGSVINPANIHTVGKLQSILYGTHTPLYASPQQAQGAAPHPQDDIYALGVIGYQLLSAQIQRGIAVDFAEELADLGVQPSFIQLIKQCVAPRPERRFPHMQALIAALHPLTTPPVLKIPAITPTAPKRKKSLQNTLYTFETALFNSPHTLQRHRSQAQQWLEQLPDGSFLEMVFIPGGVLAMGGHDTDCEPSEHPIHRVNIEDFYLSKYPITQAQWQALMGTQNPSAFKGALLPVDNLSWNDAQAFILRLQQHTGRAYMLPSEAQWEYACRAGSYTAFAWGDQPTPLLANYNGIKTTPVGHFPANAWGLYDLHGNVWEWCADHWHENYIGAPTDGNPWINPPANTQTELRVLRGGSWRSGPALLRSARRIGLKPGDRFHNGGFRLQLKL